MVAVYCKMCCVPVATGPRKLGIELVGFRRGRLPDPDAYLKSLLDALVQTRMLVDDSQSMCQWLVPVVIRSKTEVHTKLELTDI